MGIVCTVQTVRSAEASSGVPEPILMQRAATALAGICSELLRSSRRADLWTPSDDWRAFAVLERFGPQGRIAGVSGQFAIRNEYGRYWNRRQPHAQRRARTAGSRVVALVGTGNNGGDALWALAKLADRGVATVAIGDRGRMHAAGLAALRSRGGRMIAWDDPETPSICASADLALDGIVGIGGTGSLRARVLPAIEALRNSQVPIVAVDIPSGVCADTGDVPGDAVTADVTVTFGVAKPGLLLHPAKHHVGTLTVVDIGLRCEDLSPTAHFLQLPDLAGPSLEADAYKYSRGVVQITAGSAAYPGAAHLAVRGARGSGAGMVALHSEDPGLVIAAHPDVVVSSQLLFERADARVVGPGLNQPQPALQLVLEQLRDPAPLVVDASGLAALATDSGRAALRSRSDSGYVTVLTPHEGEFKRLGFDLSGGRLASAQLAADALGAVVVLKGPGTVVAPPGSSHAFIDTFGGPELSTAGAGDVLAGMCGGMLAVEVRRSGTALGWPLVAEVCARAVGLHGIAGRLAARNSGAITALDIADAMPRAMLVAAAARDATQVVERRRRPRR